MLKIVLYSVSAVLGLLLLFFLDLKWSFWEPSDDRDSGQACEDECALQPRAFPAMFQRIRPAIKGMWFIEIPAGYENR